MCPHGADPSTCPACHPTADPLAPTVDATLVHPRAPETPTAPSPALTEGSRVGRFVVLETLGQGGMGVVVSAYDPALDRRVALKLLRPDRASSAFDPGGAARLAREARAMARLSHPNVVPVYDVGPFGEGLFVAMEYVAGTTLHEWLKRPGRTWREALAVLLQAGSGLEAAHAAGIVHRDFKPANVLVGTDGRARVTDFGLARTDPAALEHDHDTPSPPSPSALGEPLTVAGAVMGTPGYMAPEQYEGQPTSLATDQFAFCVCLYEALYGQRPFLGADLRALRAATRLGHVPPPPEGSEVPPWIFELVRRGLEPRPADRFGSMSELLARLERDPARARRRALTTALAVVVAAGGVGAVLAWPAVRASGCHRQTTTLAQRWDARAKDQVVLAFGNSGLPFAQSAAQNVRLTLDRHLARWAEARDTACDETLRSKIRTEAQLALRLECLDRRHTEFATLVDRFQRANAETVLSSVTAMSRLTPVATCGNLEFLEARARLAPAQQAIVDELERQLAEGRMLVALGDFETARPRLEGALRKASEVGDAQTLGAAHLAKAELETDSAHYAEAREALHLAMSKAIEAGDARTALNSIARLVSVTGWRFSQPAEALTLVPLGRGLTPRADDPQLEALLDEGEADARWRMSDSDGALTAYRRALATMERLEGATSLNVARLHSAIGWVLTEQSKLGEARVEVLESRRIREELLGEDHPLLASSWNELGFLDEQLGDTQATVEAYRRVSELRARSAGVSPALLSRTKISLARALLGDHQFDEAADLLDEATADLDHVTAPIEIADWTRRALARNRARLLLARGDAPAALDAVLAALKIVITPDPEATCELQLLHGEALGRLKRWDEASAALDEATRELAAFTTEQSRAGCEIAIERTVVLLARNPKAPVVIDWAKTATSRCDTLEENGGLKARAWWLTSGAHAARGDRPAARDAAQRALAVLPRRDVDRLRAPIETFLAAND